MSSLSAVEVRMLSRLLQRALALPAAEREAWLKALPEAQQVLVPRLRERLAQAAQAEADAAPERLEPVAKPDSRLGERVGPYRLLKALGRGDDGLLWQAERADGGRPAAAAPGGAASATTAAATPASAAASKKVALLLPADPHAGERQLVSLPEHAHVQRLLYAGVDLQGRPYRAMPWHEGVPLLEHVARRRLVPLARVQLMLQVCDALADAHTQRVVHRDLRPGNLRVGDDGHVMLLDWGHGGPLRPDSLAMEMAALGQVWDALTQGVNGGADMAAVCQRALHADPAQRYPDVASFAQDLQRLLTHHSVPGPHATPLHRARLFARRHRMALAAAALGVVLVVGGSVALVRYLQRGQQQAQRADQSQAFLAEVLPAAELAGADPVQRALRLQRALEKARFAFPAEPVLRGQVITELGVRFRDLGQAEQAQSVLKEAYDLLKGNARNDEAALQWARAQLAQQWLLGTQADRAAQAAALARAALGDCSGAAADCGRAQALARQVLDRAEKSR